MPAHRVEYSVIDRHKNPHYETKPSPVLVPIDKKLTYSHLLTPTGIRFSLELFFSLPCKTELIITPTPCSSSGSPWRTGRDPDLLWNPLDRSRATRTLVIGICFSNHIFCNGVQPKSHLRGGRFESSFPECTFRRVKVRKGISISSNSSVRGKQA
ncbi:uncharacterized protein LAJ45_05057 [Morchella importuna]|uniref:uncharacterized protein n=1 Tax=Morchella importuna TaxID=1174673 RepID=UPI001E8EC1A8|nr:uncharacterized protein LAJ45_05057 [Morchella importuna]KAH8150875.1 hypothetical protein LAJ45_05057 [Morchella importuna]